MKKDILSYCLGIIIILIFTGYGYIWGTGYFDRIIQRHMKAEEPQKVEFKEKKLNYDDWKKQWEWNREYGESWTTSQNKSIWN